MRMELHLFSSPGLGDARFILDACRQILEGKDDPFIAYLPAALLGNNWRDQVEEAFRGLARVRTIYTEEMTLPEMEATLREAALVFIPGGNTFLLNHRLHISKITEYLRKKVAAGLPLAAFSAGTMLCGPNILTSQDMNMVGTSHFSGLNATPFNFSVHYPQDDTARLLKDDWLSEYHSFHENPVLLLTDGAYVRVEGKKTILVQGEAYILRKGREKEKLEAGKPIMI
jgi:dipeptidase E